MVLRCNIHSVALAAGFKLNECKHAPTLVVVYILPMTVLLISCQTLVRDKFAGLLQRADRTYSAHRCVESDGSASTPDACNQYNNQS